MALFNTEIIRCDISKRPTYESISNALTKALTVTSDSTYRRPFPSDQGWPYQMENYVHLLKSHRIVQSMTHKGNYHDNSVIENFFQFTQTRSLLRSSL